ncbi:MAG: VWA domain-containing protein [Rhodospirillales bacterium]|nr:VWA domain-containing protein [Rhodospirillales bacterium]
MANESANANQPSETVSPAEEQEISVTLIDGVCVVTTADAAQSLTAPIVIEKPEAGKTMQIDVAPGQKYFFDFNENNVQSFVQDGDDLTLNFVDGSAITLNGFGTASSGQTPATLAFGDALSADELEGLIRVVDTTPENEALEEPQAEIRETQENVAESETGDGEDEGGEQVAAVEPAAGEPSAEQLAQIEPAAGDEPGAGAQNTGYGFNSSSDITAVGPLSAVGPIDPTVLQYGVEFQNDTLFPLEEVQLDDIPEVVGPQEHTLDETNLNLSQSGKIDAEFGNDGPGTIIPDGNFAVSGSLLGGVLQSGGQPVDVQPSVDGYIGTINGGATTVFELVIDPDTGDYTYEQVLPFDHADGVDPNDAVQLSFGIIARDKDGDTAATKVIINVLDDAPITADPDDESINENALKGGPITVGDTLNIDYGNDTPGEVVQNGVSSATGDLLGGVLQSGGQAITITPTANGYVGTINGGATTVFTLVITNAATGAYEFTLFEPLDHTATGTNIDLNFGVNVVDYDGDALGTTITIHIKDSAPDINDKPEVGKGIETVDETNLPGVSVSGKLDIDFGTDAPGVLAPNGSTSSSVPLTSSGQPVTITQTATGYAGSTAAGDVFTLTIQPDGSYTFNLLGVLDHPDATNPDDAIQLVFGVTASDSDGDTDTGTITINVKDDGPVAVDDGKTLLQNTSSVSGNVTANDDGGEDVVASVTNVRFNGVDHAVVQGVATVVNGQYGVLTINSDGSYTYVSKGTNATTVQDVFTYTLTDFDGDSDTANLTITVQDVDSKPIIADPAPLVVDETDLNPTDDDSNSVTADFGYDGPGTFEVTGVGTFSFTGAENNQLTSHGVPVDVSVAGNSYVGAAGGETIFTLDLNETTGQYTFTLYGVLDHADETNPDDHINLKFGVTAKDTDDDTDAGFINVVVKDDGPIAYDDCNEFSVQATNKDFNVVLVLDISGSMAGDKLTLLKAAVAHLLGDFNDYQGGEIKVHIVPFSTDVGDGQTFTVTDDVEFNAAVSYLNGLNADGLTNYEAPLSSAIDWLQGATANDPIPGADTYTYFVSDGAPNRYLDDLGNVVNPPGTEAEEQAILQAEITGTSVTTSDGTFGDNSDEVGTLQSLSKEVIGVGIGVSATTLARLAVIDSDGVALDVQDPNDLDAALQGTNPLKGIATGNVITGLNGGTGAADDLSEDIENTVIKVAFKGVEVVVDPVTGAMIDGDYGTLEIFADGSYTYTLTNGKITNDIVEQFVYTLKDYDDDGSEATLTLKGNVPLDIGTETLVVDESDLNPTDTDSGVVTGNFAPGVTVDYDSDGGFSSSVPLTSSGQPVDVSVVGNDYVGKVGTETIFTLALNPTTGAYTFTLIGVLDHPDATNPNDGIHLSFGVTATASDGDSDSGFIRVDVLDDGPEAVDDTGTVAQNTTSVSGNVLANDDGGEDVVATVTNVRFNGVDHAVVNGIPTVVAGQYGVLTINANGSYTYVSNGTNPNAVQESFTYTLTDFDGDSDTANLSISIDDVDTRPEVGPTEVSVDETDLNPTDSASNVVDGNFGSDGPGTYVVTGAGTFGFTGAENNQLTSGGIPVAISVVGNSYVGKAGADTIFTLVLNETTGAYTFTLIGTLDHADETNPNDVIKLTFGVTAEDADGDTDTGFITVNVYDDGPAAVDDTGTVAQNTTSVSGNVLANDDGGEDVVATVTNVRFNGVDHAVVQGVATVVNGQHGVLTIGSDGSYTYVSNGANQVAVNDIFTYTLTDYDGDRDMANLTITVQDVDSKPIIADPAPLVVDETDLNPTDTDNDVLSANFGLDTPGTFSVTGAGTFSFSGATNNQLTSNGVPVNVTVEGNDYVGRASGVEIFRLSLNNTTGEYEFILSGVLDHADTTNPDDVIELTFGVTATDVDGDTDTGAIVVRVKDDGPAAVDDTGTVAQNTTSVSGNVLANDDGGEDVVATVTNVRFNGVDHAVVNGIPTVVSWPVWCAHDQCERLLYLCV